MSIITTPALLSLWTDAQRHPEWATTRFWEYFLNCIVFNQDEWAASSQQPPSHVPGVSRRVDSVVEHIDLATGISSTVLFVEMKRAAASQTELTGCEHQAFTAGCEFSIDTNLSRVWAMTCIGSQARLWIVGKNRDYLIPYFLITHGKAERAEYVEVSGTGGIQLLHCLNYIKSYSYPPSDVVEQLLASSSSDDSSYPMDDSSNEPESPEVSAPTPAHTVDPFTLHGGDTTITGDNGDETTPYQYLDPITQDWSGVVGDTPVTTGVAGIEAEAEAEEQAWVKVSLRKISHITRRDEFTFPAVDGKVRSTDRGDWDKVIYKNKNAWFIRYRGTYYYTRNQPTS
ncbi:hypothetical protein SPBR_03028 [Sporothrix brasiliensis 5110]|uniref:Uncharacterized protein n=1 Tax=Sporothrix brasiliensis 5110 TaxID=1398154 RepID=A0A0C2F0V4_9PEZI|nr:uncharacterized protein SPBR_03028 [Sporothrix brasiliensis 5110]KIH92479.1 hypothetical protein SPBR_03028 [Sporothrix brasiliensis 5110]